MEVLQKKREQPVLVQQQPLPLPQQQQQQQVYHQAIPLPYVLNSRLSGARTSQPMQASAVMQSPQMARKKAYVCIGNHGALVRKYFEQRGWVILDKSHKNSTTYDFKWTQLHTEIDWQQYKDYYQLVNHLPNIYFIYCTKVGLYMTFRQYELVEQAQNSSLAQHYSQQPSTPQPLLQAKALTKTATATEKHQSPFFESGKATLTVGGSKSLHALHAKLKSSDFYPETYMLNLVTSDMDKVQIQFVNGKHSGVWILKPAAANCGNGIQIITDIKAFKEDFLRYKTAIQNAQRQTEGAQQVPSPLATSPILGGLGKAAVIQKYIENPLLIDGRKFDIRCYLAVVCTKPLVVLFHHGYVRLSLNKYTPPTQNDLATKITHLTNAAVQKYHPDYQQQKESSIWSMSQLEAYVRREYKKEKQFMDLLYSRMKEILKYTFMCGEKRLQRKLGCFELMGVDFMFDDTFKPYMIEINTNPAILTDTTVQKEVIPYVVYNTLDIVMQIHENRLNIDKRLKAGQVSFRTFDVLYNEATLGF